MRKNDLFQSLPDLDAPLAIRDVPRILAKHGFRRVHLSTVYRWKHKKKIEVTEVGGVSYTTLRSLVNQSNSEDSRRGCSHDNGLAQSTAELLLESEGL